MPIRKDETGKRWVELQFITPGTPEQVWRAMATGPGNAAWFTKATIEERIGGQLRFHFGSEVMSSGEVTMWEPPHRFGYVEREWGEGAPPLVTEITIAARSGGRCVVRMVHSLFSSTNDWDDQMEGFENGWPAFFDVLRIYLANFAGLPAASSGAMTNVQGEHSTVWARLTESLNLHGSNVGERRAITQPERLAGIVERIHQDDKIRSITLRLDAPVPGVLIVGTYGASSGINASVSMFIYDHDAEALAAASAERWQDWIKNNLSK